MSDTTLEALQQRLRDFVVSRDWDQFHAPKNLAMALAAEAGELLEHFQWLSEAQSRELSPEQRQSVAEEIADVFLYLLLLCRNLGLDLVAEAGRKLEKNMEKYPVELAKGKALKYNLLDND